MSQSFGERELCRALNLQLSEAQWAAVSAPLEPGVIIAGAGTGKTTSMSARVAYLVGSGQVTVDRVLGLTFTNKAARQLLTAMRSTVAAIGVAEPEPTVSTYNAFAARIVSEFGMRIGREPDAVLLADGAKHVHAYRVVCGADAIDTESLGALLVAIGKSPKTITEQMLDLDGELSELGIDPGRLMEHDRTLMDELASIGAEKGTAKKIFDAAQQRFALAQLIVQWREYKARRDLWDYSDQVRLAREIVTRFPDAARDIRRRYDVVLLDEYQDTSIAQRELLQCIFGDGFPVTAVGDPCQAIYGWRGASVDNIESFPHHFPRLDGTPARRYALAENRRSGPAVLHIANEVATELRREHAGTEPLFPTSEAAPAEVKVGLFSSIDEELDYLAHSVRRAHAEYEKRRSTDSGAASIAVLCTTGADIRRVDRALRKVGVPTHVTGAAALLADPAVGDLRALLEVVHEPTANPSMVRLLSGARWRVGVRDLAALGGRASELAGGRSRPRTSTVDEALDEAVAGSDPVDVVSLSDAAADPGLADVYSPQALRAFSEISTIVDRLRQHAGDSVVDLAARAMRVLGVDVEAHVNDPTGGSRAALADFLSLATAAEDVDGRTSLGAFLSRLREAERFDVTIAHTRPGVAGAVQLMTVFAAKGLEFESVFMPFVSERAFPGGKGRSKWPTGASVVPWPIRDDVTPELGNLLDGSSDSVNKQHDRYLEALQHILDRDHERLAYVGVTRAERSLTVTGHWWGPGQEKPRGPHRFLTQIRDATYTGDPDLCTIVAWADAPDEGATNPVRTLGGSAWPQAVEPTVHEKLLSAAEAVQKAARSTSGYTPPLVSRVGLGAEDPWEKKSERWHEAFAALMEESLASTSSPDVSLGAHVGASTFLRALKEPDALALDLLRPMPRQPSLAAARGIAWHAWVETVFGQQSLWDMDDLPGAADAFITTDAQLEELKAAFRQSRYAGLTPVATEEPFSLVIGGRVINGRMDAVFFENGRYEVVDWKTGGTAKVDPRQLAIYRLAWSHIAGVPWRDVDAAFVMVATGEELRPSTDAEVEELLTLE
jgi:DNA helicase-2/ATP-dependent DNA helicase PcrA